ncbi:MAG: chromosome segregation protein SMC [Candidatus Zixiibacteriota bacterium]|nr:MAG: chromosome segregation protein SMC [candidate division Zixibacteria bacterium]
MHLKKLDIIGFKSFANKTTIHFSSGITAIVGPNGCGKTNILDALRWVLGEQKVTLLRGSKMEEVIFNGTRDMKPLGMAEVTLSLVNDRGILPTEYTEVQITRRLFRSGESEYLLNKVPCRLKDITELFYDTGVGAHSYSVIQQDMIEAVISDKAEERRFLFEEAAGITKYKQRKKAAIRKLEATENDWLRLNDIYAEVKTQVNSLRRQQKKAERYQKVVDSVRQWELFLSSQRIGAVAGERRQLQASADRLADRLEESKTAVNSLASQLEVDRTQQIEMEQELTRVGAEVYEISEQAHGYETEISILKEKKRNAADLIERNENDIVALKKRSEMLREQLEETKRQVVDEKEKLVATEAFLKEAEKTQAEADRRLLAARSAKEQENKHLLELEGKLSSGKTEEVNLREQTEELAESAASVERQLDENRRCGRDKETEYAQARSELERLLEERAGTERSSSELSGKLEELISRGDDITQEISNLTASIEACQARKNLLEEMMLHYEGYESGVKAVMDVRDRWPGIHGTVAERFVPEEGFEVATEAALGELARFIICDDRRTGEAIIGFLKSESKGRAGILVPDTGTINPAVKRPQLEMPEFIGWLDDFITADQPLVPLMRAVLSRTAVFKSGFEPDEILRRLPYGFQAVSTSGDLYSKNTISGGSQDNFPLFRRKEKVKQQAVMIAKFEGQLVEVNKEKGQVTAEIAAVRAELSSLAEKTETLAEDIETAREQVKEIDFGRRSLGSERARLEKERTTLTGKLERVKNRQYTLGLDFNQLSRSRETLVNDIAQSLAQLEECEAAAANALQQVSELQVRQVECRSLVEQTESKTSHLEELLNDIAGTVETKTEEISQARQQIAVATESTEELESKLKETFQRRQEAIERQSAHRVKQSELLEKADAREKQLKELRSEREGLSDERHQLEMRLNTMDAEVRSICERIRDEYEIDIRASEIENPDSGLTEEEARTKLHELKERLKGFGAVNLLALEEYKTAAERKAFLEEQLKDLSTAKDDLKTTIVKVNHTARQMFLETFDQVRVNFRNLFVELFTGGEADIFLKDPSDPLESDIEIIARPKGKKLLSITMMSGGERALTAISLLFSLYLVKPSPFCILDEIDAPLDDANCQRFLRIIRKFSEQTQFIIITHNKITMEAAHNLYGVTMEQFGVSKMVAVKFGGSAEGDSPEEIVEVDDAAVAETEAEPGNGNRPVATDPVDAGGPEELPARVAERLGQPISESRQDDEA